MSKKEQTRVGELAKPSREYGEEYPSDAYDKPCEDQCRLGLGRCSEIGRCRLETRVDRRSRCFSAHYDNRRGVMHDLHPNHELQTVVSTRPSRGLPQFDPVCVAARALEEMPPDGGVPKWGMTAENYPVDGPHYISLEALKMRIDNGPGIRKKKSK